MERAVVRASVANKWDSAQHEWIPSGIVEEDLELKGECICGKFGLRFLFTIRNIYNNNTLFYIGSECIQYFDNKELLDADKAVRAACRKDKTIFDPMGSRTEVSGMTYLEILTEHRRWLEFVAPRWKPKPDSEERNKAFSQLFAWYEIRKKMVSIRDD